MDLTQKYKPDVYNDLVGNPKIIKDLKEIIESMIVPCDVCGKPTKTSGEYGYEYCSKECVLEAEIYHGNFIVGINVIRRQDL